MGYKKKFYGAKLGNTEIGLKTNVLERSYKSFKKSVKLPKKYRSKRCKKYK